MLRLKMGVIIKIVVWSERQISLVGSNEEGEQKARWESGSIFMKFVIT